MQVLLHTDNHVEGGHEMAEHLSAVVKDALARFGEHVTQVEAHLADENGAGKAAPKDVQCTLSASVVGRDPVVVKSRADSAHQAIAAAAAKLKRAVATVLEKHDPRQAQQRSAAAPEADDS
jgi:ribosome-associated translation inhibitor RaiA